MLEKKISSLLTDFYDDLESIKIIKCAGDVNEAKGSATCEVEIGTKKGDLDFKMDLDKKEVSLNLKLK